MITSKNNMKRLILLGLVCMALMLTGCGLMPAPKVVEVKVPVQVQCKVTHPDRPLFAVDGLPVGSGIWEQMKALRAERLQRIGYEIELEAAVRACQ